MKSLIKPCPFCGGRAQLGYEDKGATTFAKVRCMTCYATTRAVKISTTENCDAYRNVEIKAIEAWNRRADHDLADVGVLVNQALKRHHMTKELNDDVGQDIQDEGENNRLCNDAWIIFRERLKAQPTMQRWIDDVENNPVPFERCLTATKNIISMLPELISAAMECIMTKGQNDDAVNE